MANRNRDRGTAEMSWLGRGRVLLLAVLALALAACGGGGGGEDDDDGGERPSLTIAVTPATITLGGTATVSWNASGATACTASGAWSGTRGLNGNEIVTPDIVGALGYTLSCDGSGGSISRTATLTVEAPSEKETMTLTGFVIVAGIPSQPVVPATVVITVGDDEPVTTTTDGSGAYTIQIEVEDDDDVVTAIATAGASAPAAGLKSASGSQIKLASILGSVAEIKEKAGEDDTLSADDNIRNNLTQLSTAEYALAVQANGGSTIVNAEQLGAALAAIDSSKMLDLAGTIKLIAQDPDYALPSGTSDTLAFALAAELRDTYVAQIKSTPEGQADLDQAIAETLSDPKAVEAPTATEVPATLILAEPVASDPAAYTNSSGLVNRFALSADGTGNYSHAGYYSTTIWSLAGSQILVELQQPVVTAGLTYDSASGEQVPYTNTIRQLRLSKTGEHTYSLAYTFETSVNGAAPSTTEVLANKTVLQPGVNLRSMMASSMLATTWAASTYSDAFDTSQPPEPNYNNHLRADVVRFNENGAGYAPLTSRDFTYRNRDDGALELSFEDGSVVGYYHYVSVNADAGFWYVETIKAGRRYGDLEKYFKEPVSSGAALNDDASIPGRYFQFGYGQEYKPASDRAAYAQATGFALRLSADGTVLHETSEIDESGQLYTGVSSRSRYWRRDVGGFIVNAYYDGATDSGICNPAVTSTCVNDDRRTIRYPRLSKDGRYIYWIEQRQFGTAEDGYAVTPSTPSSWFARWYEVQSPNMLAGTWEPVSYNGVALPAHQLVFNFFPDGRFLTAADNDDPNCENNGEGLKLGSYGWSPAVGAAGELLTAPLGATYSVNQIGGCGLGEGSPLTLNGLGEIVVGPEGDQAVLRRVPSLENQLVGSWLHAPLSTQPLVPPEKPAVLTFFPDGRYVAATMDSNDPNCNDGVEFGQYHFDAAAGGIVFHDLTLDTSVCGTVDEGDGTNIFPFVSLQGSEMMLGSEGAPLPFIKLTGP